MAKTGKRLPSALGVSIAIHVSLAVLLLMWAGLRPEEVASKVPPLQTKFVFMQHSGAAGGGGGNPAPAPPSPTEIPAHKTPVVPTVAVQAPVEPPVPTIDVSAQTLSATTFRASGVTLNAPPGPGGGGRGTGAGPEDGPGVGPGSGGNRGGGPRGIGDGVTSPEPILRVKPLYTSGALTAKIQGSVTLDVVVLADGTVGDVKVAISLDRIHGLDLEAIKAARQWIFRPGMFEGKPVDVFVRLILDFNLR